MKDSETYRLAHAVNEHIRRVLYLTDGNKSLASALLGMSRRTLQRWCSGQKISYRPR